MRQVIRILRLELMSPCSEMVDLGLVSEVFPRKHQTHVLGLVPHRHAIAERSGAQTKPFVGISARGVERFVHHALYHLAKRRGIFLRRTNSNYSRNPWHVSNSSHQSHEQSSCCYHY